MKAPIEAVRNCHNVMIYKIQSAGTALPIPQNAFHQIPCMSRRVRGRVVP